MEASGLELHEEAMSGKFEGYLICSDYDGTFATAGAPVPENLPALAYFVQNGGRFTLATGRTVEFIRDKGLQDLINAPACLCNGSVIYDYREDKLLQSVSLDFTVEEFLSCVDPALKQMLYIHIFDDSLKAFTYEAASQALAEMGGVTALKILCKFETEEAADAFRSFVEKQELVRNCHICKSWALGVEINAKTGTKGHGLEFVKAYLGDIHTAVGVGNYENDIPLLTHGDIGAAPEGSQQLVLDHADMILCPCEEGAIRDLIEKLNA